MIKNEPLDMAQYNKIFGTCRIPRPKRDELVYNSNSKHIIVIHNNNVSITYAELPTLQPQGITNNVSTDFQFFKLETYYTDGQPLTVDDLYDNLLSIVEESIDRDTPVGVLSSENRDVWAQCYQILEEGKFFHTPTIEAK